MNRSTRQPAYEVLLAGPYFCDLIFARLPRFPRLGEEIFSREFDFRPGGSYNTALALHRLGVRTGWACDFGEDIFSRFVLEAARRDGLDSSLFQVHPFPLRRVSAALSTPQDRAFVSFMDPDLPGQTAALIRQHRPTWLLLPHLHYGAEHRDLFAAAREARTQIYMDCQSTGLTLRSPGVAEALSSVDIFAPNQAEALQLTGAPQVESALDELAGLAPVVVVKLGAAGSIARSGGQTIHVPGLPVEVVDTTAAGDSFNAGFLYAALKGASLEHCLRCGNICGGLSATGYGAKAAPTADELEDWLWRTGDGGVGE